MITQEARRLSQLIDNLLDLSRLEAGAAEPQRDWCDLREVIQAAVEELQLPGDTFRLQLAPDMPLIKADASQLQRAFVNLLGNSARHSGGHPVQVRAMALHNRIMVRVVDRGPGIPPLSRSACSSPSIAPAPTARAPRAPAWGSRSCAASSRPTAGACGSSRCPNQGTTFALELPLDQPTDAAVPADAPAPRRLADLT